MERVLGCVSARCGAAALPPDPRRTQQYLPMPNMHGLWGALRPGVTPAIVGGRI